VAAGHWYVRASIETISKVCELGPFAAQIYMKILEVSGPRRKTVCISATDFSSALGLNAKTVRRYLKMLDSEGHLVVTITKGKPRMDIELTDAALPLNGKAEKLALPLNGKPDGKAEKPPRVSDQAKQTKKKSTIRGKSKRPKDTKVKSNVRIVFEHWISHENLTQHRKMSDSMRSQIIKMGRVYPLEDLLKSIDNYSTVLASPEHYWTHRWGLDEFMGPRRGKARGVDLFLDERDPLEVYREENKGPANADRVSGGQSWDEAYGKEA